MGSGASKEKNIEKRDQIKDQLQKEIQLQKQQQSTTGEQEIPDCNEKLQASTESGLVALMGKTVEVGKDGNDDVKSDQTGNTGGKGSLEEGGENKKDDLDVIASKKRKKKKKKHKSNTCSTQDEAEIANPLKHSETKDFIRTIYGKAKSTGAFYTYAKLDFNVNAYHGGCTSLLLISCLAGGNEEQLTAEIRLVRSGFDCHQVEAISVVQTRDKTKHKATNKQYIDEEGFFIADCLFGDNHIMLLSNDCRNGNLRNGVFTEIIDWANPVETPLNVNGGREEAGCGLTLILCSYQTGEESNNAVYIIMSGFKNKTFKAEIISGDDKYKFGTTDDGILTITGPAGSRFGMFHNRDNLIPPTIHNFVSQTQCLDGSSKQMLMEIMTGHCTLLILCSNSNGTEDSTVSSMYCLSINRGKLEGIKEMSGSHGSSYEKSDLWEFEVLSAKLFVIGPTGPCRYGILSNIKASREDLLTSVKQDSCLATDKASKTRGSVSVTLEGITGKVRKSCKICLKLNHKIIRVIPKKDLKEETKMYSFSYKWTEEEKKVGFHMIRVFAVRKNIITKEEVYIELAGSPFPMTRQKPGVIYALNCGGPAYQDLNDIVYSSEHKQFASFTFDFLCGCRSKIIGQVKRQAVLPASMLKSHDGFLYAIARTTVAEEDNNYRFIFTINDLPNGQYKLRLHLTNMPENISCNDIPIEKQLVEKIEKLKSAGDLIGPTCYCVDIDVKITNHTLKLFSENRDIYKHHDKIAGFALLDKNYKDKVKTETQLKEEDNVQPLTTSSTRKPMTIVGWSSNLLQNASGQSKDMSHWTTSGQIKVAEGGYGTESCFVTSFMWCSKFQEVNLLDTFSEEYLDTAPDIQVLEMYKEGRNGGGFYQFTAQLLTEDRQVLQEYTTGELGSMYFPNQPWHEASKIFSNYGPGARKVTIFSKGKDDKYWAGDFGPYMSAAEIRVKREANPAEGDGYMDIPQDTESNKKSNLDQLVTKILTDNHELLKDIADDQNTPADKDLQKQTALPEEHTHKWTFKKRVLPKKREVRLFVSSTFRDFKYEREELIKKTFRELNKFCADRGVFFTYVDLRWGITSEQTDDGKTIAICLQEIDRCRPYFICLMGDRFGWCQREEKKDDVLNMTYDYAIENNKALEWIDKHRYNSSVTQLEVFHGVLNNPEAAKEHCFFYMRDTPSPDGYTEKEYKGLMSESEWHRERQDWLKSQVRNCPGLSITRYKTVVEVAELITKDLKNCVNEDFPEGTELTKLERQGEAHNAFADARCRVYIGRQDYFKEIDRNRSNNVTKPFVILGESGSGKSALVANWAKRVEVAEPETFMFVHFIGSSADSADYIKLLRRLFEEMKVFFKFGMQIPASDSFLIRELGQWLRMAGSLTKCVIVFDALNQLDDGSGVDGNEHDLLWIPAEIPPNVFILLSTLPGRTMTACVQAEWPNMKVQPLEDSQKLEIITDYLHGIYGKTMNDEQKEMIIGVKQTSNPLYLKSLLDEVRMYGSFRTLTAKIQEYLTADNPQDLFFKILERLEGDFETGKIDRKHLVHDATTAIWCSNKGMSEAELVELLNVPSVIWSPFYLSLYENIVNRNGLLNFFHDHLRQAVEKKYLSTPEAKKKGYLRLAEFHSSKETSDRTVEELPFLLTRAGELDKLKEVVSDLDVFYKLSDDEDGIFDLVKAWKTLGGFALSEEVYMSRLDKIPKQVVLDNADYYCKLYRTFEIGALAGLRQKMYASKPVEWDQLHACPVGIALEEFYAGRTLTTHKRLKTLNKLGDFYLSLGLMEAAKKVYKTLIKQLELNYGESHGTIVYDAFGQSWKYRCKDPDVIKALQNLGTVHSKLGEYDMAVYVYKDAICRQNRIETPTQQLQLCEGLLGLSTVYIQKEDMTEAKKLMTRALELATGLLGKKHHFVAAIYTRLGQLSYKQGRVDEALAYYMQDLKATRSEVGTNHPRTALVLNEIGLVYDDKNNVLAGKFYEAALSIILDTYGNNYLGTGTIRYNLGAYYFGTNYFAKAKYQLAESYKTHVMFLGEDHPDTISVKEALDTLTKMSPEN